MSDTATIPPGAAAAYALNRLRKLADGNGVAPESIRLFSAEEKDYEIQGIMTLSPLFETRSQRHIGPPRGAGRTVMSSALNMRAEVERRRQEFQNRPAWIADAVTLLKEHPGEGWGLDDVRIPLSKQSAILAASEPCTACQGAKLLTCPQCLGQGAIVCPQCRGNRQEICPICNGSGVNPLHPDQRCGTCNGNRYVPCRSCHGSAHLSCPTCHGRRGVMCAACNGSGLTTEEIAIECGARTSFRVIGADLPSGLRRGLDRLQLANLVKGHADIASVPTPEEEEEEKPSGAQIAGATSDGKKQKAPKPEVHYRARMPYADLRMTVGGKQAVVGVFGKKKVLLGVPAFLDTALEPAREKLRGAAKGAGGLEEILKMRAMRDALSLQLSNQGKPEALRRIYPLGLTQNAAAEILTNMRLAVNRMTLRMRALVASACALAGMVALLGLLLAPWRKESMQGWPWPAQLGCDCAALAVVLSACWFGLSVATRFALRKRFPDFKIPVRQNTGKTGALMLTAVLVTWLLAAFLLPDGPEWAAKLPALAN